MMNETNKLQEKRNFFRSVGVVSVLTMLSRILGMVREIVRANYLGTGLYSDAFSLAFSLPNLFRRLTAEGIMSTAFIPILCEVKKESEERAFEFTRNFFLFFSIILTLFTLLFTLLAPWLVKYVFAIGFTGKTLEVTIFLTQVMFGYIILISLAAICQGALNSFSVFWISSLTPVLLNLSIIGCATLIAPHMENPAIGFAIGVLVGGFFQLFSQFPTLRGLGFRMLRSVNFRDPKIKEVFKLMIPAVLGAGIYQVNIIISNQIATTLHQGSLSSLTFSNRLLELVLGVFVVSLATVILPRLSNLFLDKEYQEIEKKLSDAVRLIAFITLPVIAGTLVLSEEIVVLLFKRGKFDEQSVIMTVGALRFHIVGLVFIGWNRILLTSFQASKRVKRPVQIAGVVVLVNLSAALILSQFIGHLGIALASTVSQAVQTLCLIYFLKDMNLQQVGRSFLNSSIFKNLLLSLIMFGGLLLGKQLLDPLQLSLWLRFPILVLWGGGCFLISAFVFKSREMITILNLVRKRGKR